MTGDLTASNLDLPVIDFAGASEDELARLLDATETGFCYFSGIGVDPALVEGVFDASRRFHALPNQAKNALAMNRFHRGYMAPKTSIIGTSTVARVTRPNDSESFMLMHEVAADDPRYGRPLDGPNQWPDLPGFRTAVNAYEQAMHGFCLRLLPALALALDLPRDWFAPFFQQPTTFLRLLHYPPQAPGSPDDAFGSAPHTDYGFITILAQDAQGGLEVRRRHVAEGPADPGHLGGECRRHARPLDQRTLAIHAASGQELFRQRPLFVSVFLRHVDGQHRRDLAHLPRTRQQAELSARAVWRLSDGTARPELRLSQAAGRLMAAPPLDGLEVSELAYAYDGALAVRNVSLVVKPGEIVALLGTNGAGKSTTVGMIAGVLRPQHGTIRFADQPLTGSPSHVVVRRGITLVPEGRLVFPQMTVMENLQLGAHVKPRSQLAALVQHAFSLFPRLSERRGQLAGSMSGGEQQMLAIARGLMAEPRLIILDEPSLGLMPTVTQELFRLIQTMNGSGISVLLVEQNLHQALRIAHRGYVLEKGEVVLAGTGKDLLADAYVQRAFLGR
jgi:branched-chain amino acid transport system ATP-binding protein